MPLGQIWALVMNRKHHTVVVINVLRSSDERDIDVLSHIYIHTSVYMHYYYCKTIKTHDLP